MELRVGLSLIGFLINDESLRAVADDFRVLVVLHRPDFERQRGDERLERVEAVLEVAVGNKLRVLSGDEQNVAESKPVEMPRLGHHLVHR